MSSDLCIEQSNLQPDVADSTDSGAIVPYAADSLDAYCADKFGQLCVDEVIDPACPALTRVDNSWRITNNTALLCQRGCLKAMCTLQEAAKAATSGTNDPLSSCGQARSAQSKTSWQHASYSMVESPAASSTVMLILNYKLHHHVAVASMQAQLCRLLVWLQMHEPQQGPAIVQIQSWRR